MRRIRPRRSRRLRAESAGDKGERIGMGQVTRERQLDLRPQFRDAHRIRGRNTSEIKSSERWFTSADSVRTCRQLVRFNCEPAYNFDPRIASLRMLPEN